MSTGVGEPSGGDVTPDPTDPDPTDPSDPIDPAGPTSAQPADYVGGCRAGATGPATAAPWLIWGWLRYVTGAVIIVRSPDTRADRCEQQDQRPRRRRIISAPNANITGKASVLLSEWDDVLQPPWPAVSSSIGVGPGPFGSTGASCTASNNNFVIVALASPVLSPSITCSPGAPANSKSPRVTNPALLVCRQRPCRRLGRRHLDG